MSSLEPWGRVHRTGISRALPTDRHQTGICGNDDTFLDLESSSISLGTQHEMPDTEADAEPDVGDSQSGGTISNVNEESGSDVDEEYDSDIYRGPSEARVKRIARQLS